MIKQQNIIKRFINYLGTFPNAFSENSTKLLALLLVAISGTFLAGIVTPFILIWDVITNGYVKTDLPGLGIFILSLGGFIFGASFNVKVPKWAERRMGKTPPPPMEEYGGSEMEDEEVEG